MVEYETADSGISQVISQDNVGRAALFVCEGVVFAKLVRGALSLCIRKIICQNIDTQCSEGSRQFSAVRFNVPSGSADLLRMASNSSAPFAKASLFRYTSFVARHNIQHFLVLQ